MASFTKRGKTWQYTVSNMVNGESKPIRKGGFATKKEAQVAAAEVEAKLSKGIIQQVKPIPFDEYFEDWINTYKKDITNNTRHRYLNSLKTIKEYFSGVPIQKITKRSYQEFLNSYGKTHARETTKKINTQIRSSVKDAIDDGIIATDFTRKAVIVGLKTSKRAEEKHLNYFDSKRLLKALSKPTTLTHYLILLGLTSGLRYAELVGLTREDFNFKTNELTVNKTWGYTKRMHVGFGATKNESSIRTISINKNTMTLFKELFESTPPNIHGLVFHSPTSKHQVLCNTSVNQTLKRILRDLNIEPITAHGLRHTHASILLYKRASIYYVSERLGHSDIDTTMKHYAHIIKELREKDTKIATTTFDNLVG